MQGGGFNLSDGKQKTTNAPIVLESNNGLSNVAGTIAMARTSVPNSATSQFFINVNNNLSLNYVNTANPGYAVFGKVIHGMEVATKIENLATAAQIGTPLPFTANANLVFIEKTYLASAYNTSLSITRITLQGSGKVESVPTGLTCGTKCTLVQTKGAALQLTATPGAGYLFSGWRGDCQGLRAQIILDTNKGNHNCTATFAPAPTTAQ